jgi:hypothetical protein
MCRIQHADLVVWHLQRGQEALEANGGSSRDGGGGFRCWRQIPTASDDAHEFDPHRKSNGGVRKLGINSNTQKSMKKLRRLKKDDSVFQRIARAS